MKDIVIGIDIGGTSTKIGIVTQTGKILAKHSLKTQNYNSQDEYLSAIANAIFRLLTVSLNCDIKLKGVGIGSPSGNYHTGIIEQAANISWAKQLDIVSYLKRATNTEILLTNDANAATLAEKCFGAAKGFDHFASITLGTGLGCGIFSEGKLVHGAFGYAGEIGHSVVKFDGRQCGCGNKGCLETYVSATGLKRTFVKMLANLQRNQYWQTVNLQEITAAQIAQAAQGGDAVALAAFEYTGRMLGWKLADLVLHTEPEAIFLVGGLANAKDLLFEPTRRHMEHYLLPVHKGRIKLMASSLDNSEAGLLGAAALIWQQAESQSKERNDVFNYITI